MSNLTCTGYASVFGVVDDAGDIVHRGAFRKELKRFVGMPLLHGHIQTEPVGRIVKAVEDRHGLFVTMEIFVDIAKGKDYIAMINGKMRVGLSIGYRAMVWDGRRLDAHEIRNLREVQMVEISLVQNPANRYCMIGPKKGVQ
jgi:HK97 family phage prohead protease